MDVASFIGSLQAHLLASSTQHASGSSTQHASSEVQAAETFALDSTQASAASILAHPAVQQAMKAYAAAQIGAAPVHPVGAARNSTQAPETALNVGVSSQETMNDSMPDVIVSAANQSTLQTPIPNRALYGQNAEYEGTGDHDAGPVHVTQRATPVPRRNITSAYAGTSATDAYWNSLMPQGRTGALPVSLSPSIISSPPVAFTSSGMEGSPNHRRNFMRRQRNEFARNQNGRNGPDSKVHIPTDAQGNVTALKSVLNRSIREIAGRVLDVSIKEFNQHRPMAFQLIEHDVHSKFTFDPPLREGYIKSYMQDALSWSRYQWRKHWINKKERHP